jgi:CubicO group peptidase (beta-lactamase class C family)
VTIHHLLTPRPAFAVSPASDFGNRDGRREPDEHISLFKNDPRDFDPGKKWLYNNSAYFLLGHIIEKVSGDSYGEYLRRTFFEAARHEEHRHP